MSFSPTTVICAEVLLLVSGPYLVFIFFLWTCFWFIPLKFHRLVSSHISPKLFFACHIYSLSLISVYLVNAALLFPNLSALSLLFMCLCDGFFFFSASFVRKRKKLNLGSKWKTDLYRSSYIPWKFMRAMVFLYLSLLFPEPRNNIWTNKCLGLVNSRSGEIPIYGISTILVGCKYLQYLHRDCYKISVFNDIWPGIGILKMFYLLNINRYFFSDASKYSKVIKPFG